MLGKASLQYDRYSPFCTPCEFDGRPGDSTYIQESGSIELL